MIVVSLSCCSNGQPEQHGAYRNQLDTVVERESFPIAGGPVGQRAARAAQVRGKWLAYGNLILEKFSHFHLGHGGPLGHSHVNNR
jgi:hypothetical protein